MKFSTNEYDDIIFFLKKIEEDSYKKTEALIEELSHKHFSSYDDEVKKNIVEFCIKFSKIIYSQYRTEIVLAIKDEQKKIMEEIEDIFYNIGYETAKRTNNLN